MESNGKVERGSPAGLFYHERINKTKTYARIGVMVMWKDKAPRYLLNPNADPHVSDGLLKRVVS